MPVTAGDQRKPDPVLQVIGYHQQTKHHFNRYARALGYMDWANQPDPFRRYDGASLISLPLLTLDEEPLSPAYVDLYRRQVIASQPITACTISRFLEYALALTAWKEAGGTRWALRSNPSSGNLHPTEGYLFIDEIPGLLPAPGLYHYAPREHGLEHRSNWPQAYFTDIMKPFPPQAFLFALTSIHWRESWKYGERGFRYCQHDIGHAIGTARIAAAALGWRLVLLEDVGDQVLASLLGIDRAEDYDDSERESPDCVAVIWPPEPCSMVGEESHFIPLALSDEVVRNVNAMWHGKANRLSRNKPDPWEIIDVVMAASWKPSAGRTITHLPLSLSSPSQEEKGHKAAADVQSAGQIIHQRRSALAFDGKTALSRATFYTMLSRVFPQHARAVLERPMPWDAVPWEPTIHLALFVHRVEGLQPGLYMFIRSVGEWPQLRQAMHKDFAWTKPEMCSDGLPLFFLKAGDARRLAAQVSCHQEIAADGAFSLGMIAEFELNVSRHGAWFYRRLFWETGIIGQILYLEAEAAGMRATGIGCFFDDPVHQAFGFQDTRFQSLYHFTVGGPVDDPRLTTLPPYHSSFS